MASPAVSSPLASTWSRYKTWAQTSRELKASLDRRRLWTLILAIAGAILVTLGQQIGSLPATMAPWSGLAAKIIGLGGAGAIALSTYFAREALSNESEERCTRCRSAEESLKACTSLYRAGVPPFDGADRDQKLLERQKKTRALRAVVLWLGVIAVILGVVAALKAPVAGWIAVIATITAAITLHVHSQRYQSLIATYQATTRRLGTLKDKCVAGGKADASRNTFIQSCEKHHGVGEQRLGHTMVAAKTTRAVSLTL